MQNKTWLGLLSWLVETNVVDEIRHSCLPRWHSHDDYDRKGAEWLKSLLWATKTAPGEEGLVGFGALGPAQMKLASCSLKSARKDTFSHMDQSLDITEWLSDCLHDKIEHHRDPLQWRYTRKLDGTCEASCCMSAHENSGDPFVTFGRVLTRMPDEAGPKLAKLWHTDDRSAKKAQTKFHAAAKQFPDLILGTNSTLLAEYGVMDESARDEVRARSCACAFLCSRPPRLRLCRLRPPTSTTDFACVPLCFYLVLPPPLERTRLGKTCRERSTAARAGVRWGWRQRTPHPYNYLELATTSAQ